MYGDVIDILWKVDNESNDQQTTMERHGTTPTLLHEMQNKTYSVLSIPALPVNQHVVIECVVRKNGANTTVYRAVFNITGLYIIQVHNSNMQLMLQLFIPP